ncbi:MarR family winged helix-turn-helix transcriptional regulator [uncultured Actinomyces sp.]|uniref:MarR family winged helix-turn-helix transcriptional regulator n=1 Tax=uncultured Actinomyces sp. TaxID=249061 RepID=UPI0028E9F801|nr:MarR family winged helix-turn-helix transcriptional regulator [uncultured Actinomyces sp.]
MITQSNETLLDESESELWHAWSSVTRAVQSTLGSEISKSAPLALIEFEMLDELANGEQPMRSGELGALVSLTRSGTSRAISRLVAKGFITKEGSSTDRRSVLVRITPEGRQAYEAANGVFTSAVRNGLLGAVEGDDRDTLLRILNVISDTLL